VHIETGGCSEGFPNLEPALAPVARETYVGNSRWRAFDAATTLERATAAIRNNPNITQCADPNCPRCRDAILGGPLLQGSHI
jgi:aminoglycoside 3-N-acetyltransferase